MPECVGKLKEIGICVAVTEERVHQHSERSSTNLFCCVRGRSAGGLKFREQV
jgi:hypothetical protein